MRAALIILFLKSNSRHPALLRARNAWVTILLALSIPAFSQDFNFQTAPGGITIVGNNNTVSTGFGNVNGLGIGTPVTGATVIPTTGGVLYTSPYVLAVNKANLANPEVVEAWVSTNFSHPLLLQVYSCLSGCSSAANYTPMSLSSSSLTMIIPPPGIQNGTVTAWLGIFVSNQNGAAAFTGTDSATLTYDSFDNKNGTLTLKHQDIMNLNNPLENLQTAVQLTLGTATGGLAVTPSADYAMNFANVNGLGIAPAAGLTVVSAAGGVVYSTPYLLQPQFSDFRSTTATLQVLLTINFAHPKILIPEDSANLTGPFNPIAGGGVQITTTAASFSPITRYLGLFVSNTSGATAFQGADSATLTFQMTVP